MVGTMFGTSQGTRQRNFPSVTPQATSPVEGLTQPARHFYAPPPALPPSVTRGAVNTIRAKADQAAAGRPMVGNGLSSGKGQAYMRAVAAASARASADGEAQQVANQDWYDNAALQQQYGSAKANEDREFRRLGDMFSQRNGALGGLLGRTG